MTDPKAAAQLASETPLGADETLHESLSAAADDEAEELELRRVLNAMRTDSELRARWRRAHLVRGVIRGESARLPRDERLPWQDEAEQDGAQADAPPTPSNLRRHGARWLGALAGTGIAAGVALGVVALFGEGGLGALGLGGGTGTEVAAEVPPVNAVASRAAVPSGFAPLPSETDLRRANAYLLQHAQHAVVASPPASMPFAKVLASHDGRRPAPTPVRYQREQPRR